MKKKDEPRIFYYGDTDDDVIFTKKQNYILPDDYEYIPKGVWFKVKSSVIYFFAKIFAFFYGVFALHLKIKNRKVIKKVKGTGYFIYGNHTNPLSDVFTPALVANTRIYTICSSANFGIPIIGSILTEIGGLPLGRTLEQKIKFKEAINTRIKEKKCVVIYPEAHLWPYYTGVREFSNKSFKYPVELNVPIICITTTYKKRKFSSKPKLVVYVDGPFYKDDKLTDEENKEKFKNIVYNTLKDRVKNTTYEYYKYIQKSEKKEN